MRAASIEKVPIGPARGSWCVWTLADEQLAFEARRSPGTAAAAGLGGLQIRIGSARELADVVPPCAVNALAEEISAGRVASFVEAWLRAEAGRR